MELFIIEEFAGCGWRLAGLFTGAKQAENVWRSMLGHGRAARLRTINGTNLDAVGLRAPMPGG